MACISLHLPRGEVWWLNIFIYFRWELYSMHENSQIPALKLHKYFLYSLGSIGAFGFISSKPTSFAYAYSEGYPFRFHSDRLTSEGCGLFF